VKRCKKKDEFYKGDTFIDTIFKKNDTLKNITEFICQCPNCKMMADVWNCSCNSSCNCASLCEYYDFNELELFNEVINIIKSKT
jgi:hypothetical protein